MWFYTWREQRRGVLLHEHKPQAVYNLGPNRPISPCIKKGRYEWHDKTKQKQVEIKPSNSEAIIPKIERESRTHFGIKAFKRHQLPATFARHQEGDVWRKLNKDIPTHKKYGGSACHFINVILLDIRFTALTEARYKRLCINKITSAWRSRCGILTNGRITKVIKERNVVSMWCWEWESGATINWNQWGKKDWYQHQCDGARAEWW
jgi:hypothetical protein